LETTAPASIGDIQELVGPKSMSGFLVEKESFVVKQRMVMSKLDPSTALDDGISLMDKTLDFLRQGQAEVCSTRAGYNQ